MGVLEPVPSSSTARPAGNAANREAKLPFMDNRPQALGEILQLLITLAVQKRLSCF